MFKWISENSSTIDLIKPNKIEILGDKIIAYRKLLKIANYYTLFLYDAEIL